MKRIIGNLRNDWVSGEWKPEGNELFAGAELIVTDKSVDDETSVVVVTDHAAELSSLIFERSWRGINHCGRMGRISLLRVWFQHGRASNGSPLP